MKAKNIIKAAIVERRRARREKLISVTNQTPGFFCVGNYAALTDALPAFASEPPDIVLGSFDFCDANEQKFIRALREKHARLPILILNLYRDGENVFNQAGDGEAGGCLLKLTIPAELLENRRAAIGGEPSFLDSLAAHLRDSAQNNFAPEAVNCSLTPHEIRLLKLLVDGHNHTTSAKILNVSYNTVKFHMRRIYQKLEVNSKSAAVAKAMRCRIIN